MATVKNQKYAIITSQAEVVTVKKMGVDEKNIFPFQSYKGLIPRMSAGDILCVASIRCIAIGACDFWNIICELRKRGIEFRSANEKYLDFSTLKPLPVVILDGIKMVVNHENDFIRFVQNSGLNIASKNTLNQRIRDEFLTVLCIMFNNDGIRKRG